MVENQPYVFIVGVTWKYGLPGRAELSFWRGFKCRRDWFSASI